jgi:hypothetical protein
MLLALIMSGRISSSSMLIRFGNAGLTMWNFGYARLGCVNLAALNENWAVFLRFFQVNTGWRINKMFPNVNSEDTFIVSKKPTILPTAVAPLVLICSRNFGNMMLLMTKEVLFITTSGVGL